jgi:hypothetical protein
MKRICLARTDAGLELPVIDVTHPAFVLSVTAAEQRALVDAFLRERPPLAGLPAFMRSALMKLLLRRSVLARGIARARGTFLPGLDTYLLKLGPDNLGAIGARPIDRRIAASLPVLSVRLRLQDVAGLLAEALAPALAARPGRPLRLVNIAGGTAIDSFNALLVLHEQQPGLLAERPIGVDVLDLDGGGPSFGARAAAALTAPGAPLAGLAVAVRHLRSDWHDVAPLERALAEARAADAVAAGSSEGGLFEYGSDADIARNLACLRDAAPAGS